MARDTVNYNPGPSALPLPVLERVQSELLDYRGTGISILETSHRSPEYDEINEGTMALVHELFSLGPEYHVLFMTGGASTQFALVPLNLLPEGKEAVYIDTGTWPSKALKEAVRLGRARAIFSSKDEGYRRVPAPEEIEVPPEAAYVHICSNNTIEGTQFHRFPETGSVPLVCDMSSDIASRRLDFSRFGLIYAGAQKNLGPAGVTLVIIREELLKRCREDLPTMLSYRTFAQSKSLHNTPPVFAVYVMKLVLEWIRDQGGLEAVERVNRAKKDLLYGVMDRYPDFYRGTAERESRSWMNVTLRLPTERCPLIPMMPRSLASAMNLFSSSSVGGIRFSLYNAVPLEGVERTAEFMEEFHQAS